MSLLANIGKNIGVIILAIIVLVIGTIPGNLLASFFDNYYLKLIIDSVLRIATTISLAWIVSSKLLKIDADELGIKPKKMSFWWIAVAIALPALVLVFYAFVLPCEPYIAKEGEFTESLINGLIIAISVGISEELIFRGIIFRYMKKTLGVKVAVIVPAILFAALHITNMNTFDLTDLLLLLFAGSSVSVLFTTMALKSGSIYPGALAHALWNTLIIGGIFGVGNIINGAGNDSYIVIPIQSANKLLTGGNFGIEAAVPAIMGYVLICLIVYKIGCSKDNKICI